MSTGAPIAIDLYCGLGGWTEGLLSEGWDVIGFDIERHVYGEKKYPAQLVLQDVLTLHGAQFADADLIVASPPCQEFSYRAMPWKRAKALPPPYLGMQLFWACFRIQQEACDAAGRYIPLVIENVCGAQRWVGDARWHFGSYYLWGDIPALMPVDRPRAKVPGQDWNRSANGGKAEAWNDTAVKQMREAGGWFKDYVDANGKAPRSISWTGSKSQARKAASAEIARIPFPLAQHIARCFRPASGSPEEGARGRNPAGVSSSPSA